MPNNQVLAKKSHSSLTRQQEKDLHINLNNIRQNQAKEGPKHLNDKLYENNPVECRKLSQIILQEKRFILCFGQNKHGELGINS